MASLPAWFAKAPPPPPPPMTLPWDAVSRRLDSQGIKEGTLQMLKHWASIGYAGAVDLMGAPGLRFMRPDLFVELEKEGASPHADQLLLHDLWPERCR